MDYLPYASQSTTHKPLNIPFVCTAKFSYDGHGFTTYPQRIGISPDWIHSTVYSWHAISDLEAFLQSWLFFGLLFDTTSTVSQQLTLTAFTKITDSGQKIVTTSSLRNILETGEKTLRQMDGHSRTCELDRITNCLRIAALALESAIQFSQSSLIRDSFPRNLRLIYLSIQALGETLWEYRLRFQGDEQISTLSLYPFWFPNEVVESRLHEAGWWTNDIQRLPSNIRLRYYFSSFHISDLGATADDHSELLLIRSNSSFSRYIPAHVHTGCCCESFQSSVPLPRPSADEFVLVSTTTTTTTDNVDSVSCLKTERASLSDAYPFVAFSHVRASGLGNDQSTSLPECQVLRLQNLANGLFPNRRRNIPFWIDTLCVPIETPAKYVELQKSQRIFRQADKVLVLDKSIMRIMSGRPQEDLVRIRTSFWAKRLWTVQEGAVARNLIFAFRNTNRNLADLVRLSEQQQDGEADAGEIPLLRNQCHLDRSMPLLNVDDDEMLLRALMRLSDDIKLAEFITRTQHTFGKFSVHAPINRTSTEAALQENRNDHTVSYRLTEFQKHRLHRILRLGLLARRHLFYLPQSDEAALFHIVVPGIINQYASVHSSNPTIGAIIHANGETFSEYISRIFHQSFVSDLFDRLQTIQDLPVTLID